MIQCAVCRKASLRHYYRAASARGLELKCFGCVLRHRPIVANALRTSAVVGTILTAINQGDILLQGAVTALVLGKMGLTFVVPYLVSCNAALAASRVRAAEA